MGELYYSLFLLLTWKLIAINADHSVHILSENLEQYITSTTLEWVPNSEYDKSILSNAVIAAYQSVEELKYPEDEDDQEVSVEIVKKPVYVCRAKINSVLVSGQLRPKKSVCVVSLYRKVSEYKEFEILVNIEDSARLSWVHKSTYTLIPQGAVSTGERDTLNTFIARRPVNSHDKEGSLTHIVGKYTHSENLGVFHLVDQNNEELPYDDGEILVETEPISYELKSVKFDKLRRGIQRSRKELGEAILKNEEDGLQHVASVISYGYDYSVFWGKGHGLLTGLPFNVILSNGSQVQGSWAVPYEEKRSDVAPIEKYLEAGTAINVTLFGNYTQIEIPYNATVVAVYKDGEKRDIAIRDTKREYIMLDVVAYYSPIYFLHNNSHVPTTTTTTAATTTSTTSTTSKTTSTTQEIAPIVSPEVITTHKSVDGTHSHKPHNNGNVQSDEQNTNQNHPNAKETGINPNSVASMGLFSLVTVLLISSLILRVT